MMHHEFEELAGYEVSFETYNNIIEPMYMALPENITKQQFVKMLDKKAFALPKPESFLKQVKKEANHLYEICGRYTDYESEERMTKAAKDYMKRKYNIDWNKDQEAFCYFKKEYEFPTLGRGCTYPVELVIGKGKYEYERINLIK